MTGVRISGDIGCYWLCFPFIGGEMKIFHSSLSVIFFFFLVDSRKMRLFVPLADHSVISLTVNICEQSLNLFIPGNYQLPGEIITNIVLRTEN